MGSLASLARQLSLASLAPSVADTSRPSVGAVFLLCNRIFLNECNWEYAPSRNISGVPPPPPVGTS